jgi:hypothetical protein
MILGFARRLKDSRAVVQTMREEGINVIGPFRSRNGTFVYSLFDCIVTEHELLDLARAGKLDAAGVSDLSAKIKKKSA